MKRLVLAGGGHAHVEVLRDLAQQPDAGCEATLVTPYPWLTYSGMVPGLIAGHYEIDACTVDLARLAERAGVAVVASAVRRVDPASHEVECANGSILPYDVLSLDVGTQPRMGSARGVEEHAVPMRPLERVVRGWSDVVVRARNGEIGAVTVVGGGAAGVEIALAMEYRLCQELGLASAHVRVISDAPTLVPEFPAAARQRLLRRLADRNVGVHLGAAVGEVGRDYVRLEHGLEFASDAVFWATGTAAHEWLRASGLAVDTQGFVITGETLASVTHPDVFAAGDCASVYGNPHARAGVFAVRAGPVLAANLRSALAGESLQRHRTSARYLALVSTGNRHAVAVWNGFAWEGDWVWRWKDRIDRRFVARYGAAGGPRQG